MAQASERRLYDQLTVRQNLMLVARLRLLSGNAARAVRLRTSRRGAGIGAPRRSRRRRARGRSPAGMLALAALPALDLTRPRDWSVLDPVHRLLTTVLPAAGQPRRGS